MLPSEYLMYKYKGEEIQPKRLPLDKANLELAAQIIAVFQNAFDSRVARWVLDEVLSALEGDDTGYRVRRGLAHILSSDYSTFDIVSPLEPALLRERVFSTAASGIASRESKRGKLESVAKELSAVLEKEVSIEAIEYGLYADLVENRILTGFETPSAEQLLERYNLAQAQGVLYRAFDLKLSMYRNSQAEYKQLFKYLKLFGLMHYIEGDAEIGFTVTVDGPSSLFKPSTRYGLAMAKLLPALLLVSKWTLEATLRPKRDYGEQLELAKFSLDAACGLVSHYKKGELFDSVLEEQFADKFEKGGGEWTLEREVDLLPLPGGGLMIPDFRLVHPDGRSYLLEIVGYWRPDYLRKKFSQIRNSGRDDLVVAVSERLNLEGAGVKLEGVGAKVVWFKGSLLPKQVLELLN